MATELLPINPYKREIMAHPVDIHVGKRLRMRRVILGMSQDALGSATGVTFQQIQKYERGINRMGSSRLYDFARILSVPIAYFFESYDGDKDTEYSLTGMAEDAPAPFDHEDKLASRETMEMMRAYYQISDPLVRRSVFELVKALAEDAPEDA